MPPLLFQAPPPRRLAVRRHFKPNGPTALSPHSGSRAVSQFAALVESATMHSFAAHSLRQSPDGSLAAITVCLPPLGRFHCGAGRLCEGWRTAPRQRDWWLSYGHHGRFLGGGSGYLQISEFPTGDFGSNRQAVSVETDRPFRSKAAPRCEWVLVPALANRRCVIHPTLLWPAKASTLVIIVVSNDCCGRL